MAKRYKENKKKKGNFILNLMLIGFIVLLIISSYKIIEWYSNSKANAKVLEEISSAVIVDNTKKDEESYTIDFKALKEKNSDAVAWLKVNGTDVEFSVVKTTNNGYYLSRNFNKEYNLGGWIFADYRNKFDGTDRNIIVYGHNMRDGSMFGSLKDIIKKEWYDNEENHKVIFITEQEKVAYEVFSVYQIEAEDYYIQTNFKNNTEFKKFADTLKQRSVKDFNVEISETDSILTLSTCANNNEYRIVLHAKKTNIPSDLTENDIQNNKENNK